ncbi:DUF2294 domain-containing protein [Paenibacillus sp. YYML68]|uniref:DUF2294 domain-containing protein n=1 Tax=Paenibacillus sp. YYML68 TaxID=2909250 RepID=UPI002491447F|nr:DUF2294 domain-containing protein [Paenibacillus sp. YYML68]
MAVGSKGALEDKISRAVTQWEKEYLGRGPLLVKSDIVRNMIVVLLKGILTPAEQKLAESREGLLSIKRIRADLIESGMEQLKEIVAELVGVEVVSVHTDISTKTGERVLVFMLAGSLEEPHTN